MNLKQTSIPMKTVHKIAVAFSLGIALIQPATAQEIIVLPKTEEAGIAWENRGKL